MVQFTCQEIADLSSSREALKWFEAHLLCDPALFNEAVQALCSQLTRGKDLCSPTKRIKLRANKVYFAKLAGFLGGGGSGGWGGGLGGISGSRSVGSVANSPTGGSFASFSLNSSLVSSSGSTSSSSSSSSSSSNARNGSRGVSDLLSLSPRSTLYGAPPPSSPLHSSKTKYEDLSCCVSVVDFARALAGQSPRWASIPADELLSLSLLIDSCADGLSDGGISTDDFLSFSRKVDVSLNAQHGLSSAEQDEIFASLYETLIQERIERSSQEVRAHAPADIAARILDGGLVERIRQFANAARRQRLNPLTALSHTLASAPLSSRLDGILDMLGSMGGQLLGDPHSAEMSRAAEVCALVDMRYDGEARDEAGSSPIDTPVRKSSRPSSAGNATIVSSSAAGAATLDIEDSLTKLRQNATSLASKLASQSDSLDSTMSIWSALQALELELKKAAPGGRPSSADAVPSVASAAASRAAARAAARAGGSAAAKGTKVSAKNAAKSPAAALDKTIDANLSASVADVSVSMTSLPASSPPKRPPVRSATPKAPTLGQERENGSSSEIDNGRRAMIVSMGGGGGGGSGGRSAMSTSMQMMTPILAQRARERVVSRSGQATTPLPFQPPPAPARAPTTQHTTRTIAPSSRANTSIFKSPGRRQLSDNVNTYDAKTFTWVPTRLTGKYNTRFQTTHDLADAKKIFPVFYSTERE